MHFVLFPVADVFATLAVEECAVAVTFVVEFCALVSTACVFLVYVD